MCGHRPSTGLSLIPLLHNRKFYSQSKGDFHGAEDYYYRATLADPDDGEILAQYAKIVWELYHDKERALSYYERAAQAAANDRYVYSMSENKLM